MSALGDVVVRAARRAADFAPMSAQQCDLGQRLTVLFGPNGAGKTNLLEALYVGCSGRSVRTRNERELVRFGAE